MYSHVFVSAERSPGFAFFDRVLNVWKRIKSFTFDYVIH